MHDSVLAWGQARLGPQVVTGKRVLEAGSQDVNGSLRGHVEALGPSLYLGIDIEPGPGVDELLPAEGAWVSYAGAFDVVICTEMLEHAEHWQKALESLKMCLVEGGFFLLSTRSPGFKWHNPPDHWRFTPQLLAEAFDDWGCEWEQDPQAPGVLLTSFRRGPVRDLGHLRAESAPSFP